MFNLIKMEMHRLTHSTVTWITIVFAILTAIFGIAMTDMDIQAVQDEPPTGLIIQENTDDDSSGMLAGVYVTGNPEWANGKIELGDLVGMELQSGLTSILCVIFVALFANADQKNGFIKNIAGAVPASRSTGVLKVRGHCGSYLRFVGCFFRSNRSIWIYLLGR